MSVRSQELSPPGLRGNELDIARYEDMRRALAETDRVDEVKDIRAKAAAMQKYAAQAKDPDLMNYAADINMRAQIRGGELLMQMAERGERQKTGMNQHGSSSVERLPALSDLGVTKTESSRWQRLASLSAACQEQKIVAAKAKAVARPPAPAIPAKGGSPGGR
jgi:hypothetical protein